MNNRVSHIDLEKTGELLERKIKEQGYVVKDIQEYLKLAGKVARRAVAEIADEEGIFPYEGKDDCGLFRGIYFRYVYELTTVSDEFADLEKVILENARFLAENGRNADGLIGGHWECIKEGTVDLAQHLSAVMVLEMAEKVLAKGKSI